MLKYFVFIQSQENGRQTWLKRAECLWLLDAKDLLDKSQVGYIVDNTGVMVQTRNMNI